MILWKSTYFGIWKYSPYFLLECIVSKLFDIENKILKKFKKKRFLAQYNYYYYTNYCILFFGYLSDLFDIYTFNCDVFHWVNFFMTHYYTKPLIRITIVIILIKFMKLPFRTTFFRKINHLNKISCHYLKSKMHWCFHEKTAILGSMKMWILISVDFWSVYWKQILNNF